MYTDRRSRIFGLALTILVHVAIAIILMIRQPAGAGGKAGHGLTVFTLEPPADVTDAEKGASNKPRKGMPERDSAGEKGANPSMAKPALPEGMPAKDSHDGASEFRLAASRLAARGARIDFQAILLKHIERYRHFPEDARQARQQGTVLVGFVIIRSGAVLDVWIDRTSGFTSLDREAVATVKRAQPLPQIPDALPDSLEVVLPVSFDLD